jgi:beta-glucanase (GH16 family)
MLYFSHRTASWPLPRLILLIHALILCFPAAVVAKPYKAGEIYTPEARLYGKYVFSMRSAKGSGVISAFFLWKDGSEQEGNLWEEVDIEVFGKDNAETWQSNIITGMDSSRIVDEAIHEHDFSFGDEFHTFTLEWTPDSLTWYVDGAVVRTEDTVSSEQVAELVSPAQLRFNLWASVDPAWVGDWDDAILPVFMHVDWVEYYAWNDTDGGFESQPLWRDDFDDFDSELWAKADWTFADNRADFIPENAYVQNGLLVLALTHEGSGGSSSSSSSSSNSASSSSGGRPNSGGGSEGCLGLVLGGFLYFFLSRRRRARRV